MSLKLCSVNTCTRSAKSFGYCGAHYDQTWRTGEITNIIIKTPDGKQGCRVEECNRKHRRNGYCSTHNSQIKRHGQITNILIQNGIRICKIGGCLEKHSCHGYCKKHYAQSDHGKEKAKRYRENYPEMIRARNARNAEQNKRQILFKGKYFRLKENPRKGICELCHRSVAKGEIKYTNLHHYNYDSKNPLANTIELCIRCHNTQAIVECVNVLELAIKSQENKILI